MGITKKNVNVYRQDYEKAGYGKVDDVSHLFGVANHERFYWEMKSWEDFTNSLMSDGVWNIIPLAWVKWFIVTIIGKIYDAQARNSYWKGVDAGRGIVGKVSDVVNWATNEIKTNADKVTNWAKGEIDKVSTYIKTDIYPPLQDAKLQIAQFSQSISSMQSQVSDVVNKANTALSNAQKAFNDIQAQIPRINDLFDRASASANKITSLEADVTAKAKQITDLLDQLKVVKDRLAKLEKAQGITPPPDSPVNSPFGDLIEQAPEPIRKLFAR